MPVDTEILRNYKTKKLNLVARLDHSSTKPRDGELPLSRAKLCLEPSHRSSVLSAVFGFSRLELTSASDFSNRIFEFADRRRYSEERTMPVHDVRLRIISERMKVHQATCNQISKVSRVLDKHAWTQN